MANHKPFREIIQPNSNFEFIENRRVWVSISLVLIAASIAMLFVNQAWRGSMLNWSIDFKGGTEIILDFVEPGTEKPVTIDTAQVRSALSSAGADVDVSDFSWDKELETGETVQVHGILVRTTEFGAVDDAEQLKISNAFTEAFADRQVDKATWSGDRVFVRANQPITWEEASEFFKSQGLTLRPWGAEQAEQFGTAAAGTSEYRMQFSVRGIDAQYQKILQDALGDDVEVEVVNVYGVGAKAGAKLRNDGIKSLFYAMGLIMLYLVFRFDIRYAPGAVGALVHDAILVVGAFAVAWEPFSLTTVAALLTVIGYSVNDSVVIFDRIRENVDRLKDKKFPRVINISLNETMSRTMLTSSTTFMVTLMMTIFGTGMVRTFAFALNVGIIVGTYSSVFIASPIALAIHDRWFNPEKK